MTASLAGSGVDTIDDLRALGFEGFVKVGMLRDESCANVPAEPGVWIVLRDGGAAVPHFLSHSTAAAWRGQDPTLSADALAGRWVAHAQLLFVSAAPGPGVRHLVQQRVKRFLRFGAGRNVAHWSGRRVWQLGGAAGLRIAWRITPADQAREAARSVIAAFEARHSALPYANDLGEEEA